MAEKNKILIVIGILSLILIGCSSPEIQRLDGEITRISNDGRHAVLNSANQYIISLCFPTTNLLKEGDLVILTREGTLSDSCWDLEKLN